MVTLVCKREDCKFCYLQRCKLLNDTYFGKRECPFFKEKKIEKPTTIDYSKEEKNPIENDYRNNVISGSIENHLLK